VSSFSHGRISLNAGMEASVLESARDAPIPGAAGGLDCVAQSRDNLDPGSFVWCG
jgi:hypothetical protein